MATFIVALAISNFPAGYTTRPRETRRRNDSPQTIISPLPCSAFIFAMINWSPDDLASAIDLSPIDDAARNISARDVSARQLLND